MLSSTIKVKNLSKKTDVPRLYNFLKKYGKILKTEIKCDPTGISNGVAYVTFENFEEAQKAFVGGDCQKLDGNRIFINVEIDHNKINSPSHEYSHAYNNKHYDILKMTNTDNFNMNYHNDRNIPMIGKYDKKQNILIQSEGFILMIVNKEQ